MPLIRMDLEAHQVLLNLDDLCNEEYSDQTVANYIAREIRGVLVALITDPTDQRLQRHRIPQDDGTIEFVVAIPTPTGIETEAAVFWKFLDLDESPGDERSAWVLAIELAYRR